jgi:hypothetical protein
MFLTSAPSLDRLQCTLEFEKGGGANLKDFVGQAIGAAFEII